jgi:ubiquinol-cytochrome c reductase cytochrome b subunit
VILPIVSALEKPLPLPSSISESVLHGEAEEAAPIGQTKRRSGSVATASAE